MPTPELSPYAHAIQEVRLGGDPIEAATSLVALMTEDERLDQLDGNAPFWRGLGDLGDAGGYHRRPFRAGHLERLGIVGFAFSDGPRGCVIGPSTAFPVSMARGASFDPALELEVGDAIGKEIAAVGASLYGGVCINLLRHPGWGRAQETYGEDPYHVGQMGVALTTGAQRHVMATVKHFALNSMENARFRVDISVDDQSLFEVYLPHFRKVIDAGVACVMTAYNSVNGAWCAESEVLLDKILRKQFGFEGFVISDWILGLRDGLASLRAGLDVEMPYRMIRRRAFEDARENGQLDWAQVDAACIRVLATQLRFGIDAPTVDPAVLACDEHRTLAYEVAHQSMVLLENRMHNGAAILPLDPTPGHIVVIGRLAARANLGDGGSSEVFAPEVSTMLAGITARFSHSVVSFHDGADRTSLDAALALADVVVCVVGTTRDEEGEYIGDAAGTAQLGHLFPGEDDPEMVANFEKYIASHDFDAVPPQRDQSPAFAVGGDRSSLRLPADDEALLEVATAHSAPVVAILMGGSAFVVAPWIEKVAAALMVFYPGMEGGRAVAAVLAGDEEPGGRLPFAIPRREEDLVDFDPDADTFTYGLLHGQWHLDSTGVAPHYPFGYGRSYGATAITGAAVVEHAADELISVALENSSARPSTAVVQIYGRVVGVDRPWKLCGFKKTTLSPSSPLQLDIAIDRSALAVYDPSLGDVVAPTGPIEIEVGLFARDASVRLLLGGA